MNVMTALEFLMEAVGLYNQLEKDGVIAEIQASAEKDKEIFARLENYPAFKSLLQLVEGLAEKPAEKK